MLRNLGWLLLLPCSIGRTAEPTVEYVVLDAPRGQAKAVSVPTAWALVHTEQIMAIDHQGKLVAANDVVDQFQAAFQNLASTLERGQAKATNIVRLCVYVAQANHAANVQAALAQRVKDNQPRFAVTYVVGKLPHPDALVALDAVAWTRTNVERVERHTHGGRTVATTLPAGPRVYVAGQAEKGTTPAEATRKTLTSLRATLEWMKLTDADVVHAKCFLTPMTSANEVIKEFTTFYGPSKTPPITFVEWTSTLPIEIELIAAARTEKGRDGVEYLTPPGMTASPIYARVTRVQSERVIYTGGLVAADIGNGEAQVKNVFAQLATILERSQSDYKHLVKATYYVADSDASQKLNELRPKYYDPKRPPSASKAQVVGTGWDKRTLTIDMIAVPTQKP